MSRLLGHHTLPSAWQRLTELFRQGGLTQTIATLAGSLDEKYLRSFDRRYRIQTSGMIYLSGTSFAPSRLCDATQYGPVNGWALRKFLKKLALPRNLHFVDLGCGLGRACILAAEYGFAQVTGVDLAAEFCAAARENIARCRAPIGRLAHVTILERDALLFCEQTHADVFFMFRPFSEGFLRQVIDKLAARARSGRRPVTIIYSERAGVPQSHAPVISENHAFQPTRQVVHWGQAFYVYQSGPQASGPTPDSGLTRAG